jgi:hypothetical protein
MTKQREWLYNPRERRTKHRWKRDEVGFKMRGDKALGKVRSSFLILAIEVLISHENITCCIR